MTSHLSYHDREFAGEYDSVSLKLAPGAVESGLGESRQEGYGAVPLLTGHAFAGRMGVDECNAVLVDQDEVADGSHVRLEVADRNSGGSIAQSELEGE